MARTSTEIRDSLASTVRGTNPNIDLDKGPVFDVMIAPVAPELSTTEQTVEDLSVLASLQMSRVVTLEQIKAIGTSFGIAEINGTTASHFQTFWTVSKPTSDIVVDRGTVVATTDGSLAFAVMNRVTMLASNANAYYNAARRRYEIVARVQAVAIGTDYNLPAFRVTRFLTPVAGMDGTENREPSEGGNEQQTFEAYLQRIQQKFLGLISEAGGGISTTVIEFDPDNIKSVVLVYPKDRKIFRRDTGRPAIDCYVLGSKIDSATQQYIAGGGEQTITLAQPPVYEITSVLIDGVATTGFALLGDQDLSRSGSARAVDRLVLTTVLTVGQVVDIVYRYNATITSLQSDLFDATVGAFGTDVLARLPVEVPVTVQIDCTVMASFDTNRVSDQIQTEVFSYIEPGSFVDVLTPERLVNTITQAVSGISSVRVYRFTKTQHGTLPVESISFEKNEVPLVDTATLVINTRQ